MSDESQVLSLLEEGVGQLGLDLPLDKLLQYLDLLEKWNQAYNLTAVRDKADMVTRHVIDSLAILPMLKGKRILDVGTGAGLPGIPLAIARPDLEIVLLDSNGKKTRFLQEVKRVLSLVNVEIIQSRVENYRPSHAFDTVISRAFSELGQMIQLTQHLIETDGIWLAMKGRIPKAELKDLQYPYHVELYQVPFLEGDRCCIIVNTKVTN